MASGETENNAYAKFWSDQQRVSWYTCYGIFWSGQFTCFPVCQQTARADLHAITTCDVISIDGY